MNTCLGKSCSFGLLCVSFVGVCQILCVLLSLFCVEGRMWDVIVLIPALGFFLLILLCSDSYCSLVVAHLF